MQRLLVVFFSIDLTSEISSLSIYSNSGLFKDSHVDMFSSKETEPLTDLLGDPSLFLNV